MKSESEMPLQVSTTPTTTPLLLPSMISDNVGETNAMSESISGRNTSRTLAAGLAAGDDRPIVLNKAHTQNSLIIRENVRVVHNATCSTGSPIESRHAKIFSEHRNKASTDTIPYANEQVAQSTQQHSATKLSLSETIHDLRDKNHDTTIHHSTDLTRSRGPYLSSANTEFPSVTQKSAEEGRNQNIHLGVSAIENTQNTSNNVKTNWSN